MNKIYHITKQFLIKEYITKDKSALKIAKEMGCERKTIYRNLINHNIPIRTISEALKGKYIGKDNPSFGIRRFGKDNPNFKHGKCNNNKCIDCGAKINYYATRCIKCGHRYQSTLKIGHLNPAWINGATLEIYPSEFNLQLKVSIRERDNYQCQICGKSTKKNGRNLDVHHIDYNKENLNPDNLISLCHLCHMKTNIDREIYTEFFKILKEAII